jgi:hypothetical protein
MSEAVELERLYNAARPITCPTCGAAVRVVGKTTMHYEPLADERVQKLEARLRALGQHPDADPECGYCNGSGERYWHTADCRDDYCALAGGYHDCRGQVEECACIGTARARGELADGR